MNKLNIALLLIIIFTLIYRLLGVNAVDSVYYSITTQTSMGPETNLVDTKNVNKRYLKL